MSQTNPDPYTTFAGHQRIATGSLQANALAVKKALESGSPDPVLLFDNATGRTIDVDTRGTDEEVYARLAYSAPTETESIVHTEIPEVTDPKGRGRPKLGVVPREVTLLPRHWEWLATQPGGASVALRKLVEEARRASSEKDKLRKAQERAYHFMQTIGGDLPGFEEITRALFANNQSKVQDLLAAWPSDVCAHAIQLAYGDVLPE